MGATSCLAVVWLCWGLVPFQNRPDFSSAKTPPHIAPTKLPHISNFNPFFNPVFASDLRFGGIFGGTDILGVSFCILELNQISPRRRAAPAHIPHGNQFGNALLLDHLFLLLLLLLLLHSFLLLDHQSPPSGFANPLTGSKSESLV